jgi:hypothetical protein
MKTITTKRRSASLTFLLETSINLDVTGVVHQEVRVQDEEEAALLLIPHERVSLLVHIVEEDVFLVVHNLGNIPLTVMSGADLAARLRALAAAWLAARLSGLSRTPLATRCLPP